MEEVSKISRIEFEKLKTLSFFKAKVASGSMIPVLNIGDQITVDVGQMDIKRYDIVVVYLNEILVCHYLWRLNKVIKPIYLQTRNMEGSIDTPIPLENYLGKVISHDLGFLRKMILLIN
jgi:signal peptidase I